MEGMIGVVSYGLGTAIGIGALGLGLWALRRPEEDRGSGMIVGLVAFSVPFGGYVAMFFRQPVGIAALVGVMVLLYLAWELLFARKPAVPEAPDPTPSEPNAAGGSQG